MHKGSRPGSSFRRASLLSGKMLCHHSGRWVVLVDANGDPPKSKPQTLNHEEANSLALEFALRKHLVHGKWGVRRTILTLGLVVL